MESWEGKTFQEEFLGPPSSLLETLFLPNVGVFLSTSGGEGKLAAFWRLGLLPFLG